MVLAVLSFPIVARPSGFQFLFLIHTFMKLRVSSDAPMQLYKPDQIQYFEAWMYAPTNDP